MKRINLIPLFLIFTMLFLGPDIYGQCEFNGIAINSTSGKIYWSHIGTYEIMSGNLDGSGDPISVYDYDDGVNDPRDVAVDPVSGKIYWINRNDSSPEVHEIWVANADGSGGEIKLFELNGTTDYANGLAINPSNNKIYWSSTDGGIIVANLDGTGTPSELYDDTNASSPRGITVDVVNEFIYWADKSDENIVRGNLDGSGTTILYSGSDVDEPHGIAIDVTNGKIYWSEINGNDLIKQAELDGSGSVVTLYDNSDGIEGPRHMDIDITSGLLYIANLDAGTVMSAAIDGSGTQVLWYDAPGKVTWDGGGDGSSWEDPLNWDSNTEPTKDDAVCIGKNITVEVNNPGEEASSIIVDDGSILNVNLGADLKTEGCLSDGIYLDTSAILNVNGSLLVNRTGDDGIFMEDSSVVFIGATGEVQLLNIGDDGIQTSNSSGDTMTLIVNGMLFINNIEDEGIEMDEKSVIIIGIDGEITVEGTKGGCAFEIDGTNVTNNGNIFVRNCDGDGIELDNDGDIPGVFINTSTARLIIDNLYTDTDIGIEVQNSSSQSPNMFINNGYILISNIPFADGIELENNAIFVNNCGIDISNVGEFGIDLEGNESTFINVNILNIGRDPVSTSSDTSAIRIRQNGQFLNDSCGIVNITTSHNLLLESSEDSLTNHGLMTSVYNIDNTNFGVVINKGEMRSSNNFAFSPNAKMNMDGGIEVNTGSIPSEAPLYPAMCTVCDNFSDAPIPTLGQWGVMILSILILIFGVIGLRQSKPNLRTRN